MKIKIEKRCLDNSEVDALVEEIKKFPNPLTGKKTWRSLKEVYVLKNDRKLIGVCGVVKLNDWLKLGPLVVFEKYHHQGFGKIIFSSIIKDYPHNNLYVGSRNPLVAKIALGYGFNEISSIWKLPRVIKFYLIKNIIGNLSLGSIKELIRKQSVKEGPYRNFLKRRGPL